MADPDSARSTASRQADCDELALSDREPACGSTGMRPQRSVNT
jgi:hypothetical protein